MKVVLGHYGQQLILMNGAESFRRLTMPKDHKGVDEFKCSFINAMESVHYLEFLGKSFSAIHNDELATALFQQAKHLEKQLIKMKELFYQEDLSDE